MDKKNNCQQQPDSAKSDHKWTIMNILMIMFVFVLILVMGWPIYRGYRQKVMISQTINSLFALAKAQHAYRKTNQKRVFANTIEELRPQLKFPFYADNPSDCNDSFWYFLTFRLKKKETGPWACDGDFAYGVNQNERCDDVMFDDESIGKAFVYAIPVTRNKWIYPNNWQIGACMNSNIELHNK